MQDEKDKKSSLIQAKTVKYEPLDDPFEDTPPIAIPIDMNEEPDDTGDSLVIIIGGVLVTLTILISAYLAYTS